MQVELLNKNQLKDGGFFREWGEMSHVCYDTPLEKAEQIGKRCLKSRHFSGSRATFFKFKISGITRNLSLQLNRHEVGVVKNQLSQRYVDQINFDYIMPKRISYEEKTHLIKAVDITKEEYSNLKETIGKEEARNILPGGIETAGIYGFTIEALINFMNKRLCNRSQEEIKELANKLKEETILAVPELEEYLVPSCEWLLWCPEENGCGLAPTRDQVRNILETSKCM
jgi:thymidylate synthase (FAD)